MINEQIQEQKGAVIADNLFNIGMYRIGKTVFDLVHQNDREGSRRKS